MQARGLAGVVVAVLAASPGQAAPLEGEALRRLVAGRTMLLAVPLGGEFPLIYRPDGTVTGESPQSLFARLDPKADSGRWWVDGASLCQVWSAWYDGKRHCFTIEPTGPRTVRWVRDDGLSGKARIK
jgi:hypothetical protein